MPTSDADRLPCGSLRKHEPHEWFGQVTGTLLACPGQPPAKVYGLRGLSAEGRLTGESSNGGR